MSFQHLNMDNLKGEYEDYTWGCGQNPLDYPVS